MCGPPAGNTKGVLETSKMLQSSMAVGSLRFEFLGMAPPKKEKVLSFARFDL